MTKKLISMLLSVLIAVTAVLPLFCSSVGAAYHSQEDASKLLNDIIYEVLKEYSGETVDEIVDKVTERLEEETYGQWSLSGEGRFALYYRVESYLEEYKEFLANKNAETKPAETEPAEPEPVTVPQVKEEISAFGNLEYTDTFTMSNCDFNNLTVTLNGNYLKVSGVFTIEGLNGIYFELADLYNNAVEGLGNIGISSGNGFTRTYDLSTITDIPKEVVLKIYTRTDKSPDNKHWSTFNDFIVLKKVDGVFKMAKSPNIEKNTADLSTYINPGLCINVTPNSAVAGWANQICEGITGDYDKAFAIYSWICGKIHFDRDSYNKNPQASTGFYEIMNNRSATIRGFSDLLEAMLESQGIPAIITAVNCQDIVDTLNNAKASAVQYAVEAYVDGRWIIMFPFLDHNMEIVNGQRVCARPRAYSYFDMTMQAYSANFSLNSRRTEKAQNIPSDWALDEVLAASAADIVPVKVHTNYRDGITRAEFCSLIMQMLRVKHNVNDVKELLAIYAIDYSENFYDTDSVDVNGAYLLGIVNGRGEGTFDPYSTLTRQEAAVMLANTAKFLGLAPSSKMDISDMDDADSWAHESIRTVTGLVSGTGKPVMNGVDLTRFSPKTKYTREQSILTVYRLFMCE